MAAMKAMLQKLTKEREEKEVCIKLQENKIARFTGKLGKRQDQSLTKSLESKGEEKVSVQSEGGK